MAKLVCHGEKYTKGAIGKIERHNERLNEHYGNQNIDLERSHLNYKLMECKEKNYFTSVMNLVDTRNNPTGKKLRKAEIRNLKQFQEKAIEFMKRNGMYDFFKRESIHSNKKEL